MRVRHLSERVDFAEDASRTPTRPRLHRPSAGASASPRKEYIDRLVSTDSGMVLPVASAPTDPGHPADGYREVDVLHVVRSIGELFDLVLIDAPALLASPDALDVAGQADGVVLVVPHRVALSDLRDVHDRLAFVKTPLLGYVYVRPRGLGDRHALGADTRPLRRRFSRVGRAGGRREMERPDNGRADPTRSSSQPEPSRRRPRPA